MRDKVRAFVNASESAEILFTSGATEAINLVASSYGAHAVGSGDEIIISTLEHHSNIVPWQLLCERSGAVLRVIPISDAGDLDLGDEGEIVRHICQRQPGGGQRDRIIRHRLAVNRNRFQIQRFAVQFEGRVRIAGPPDLQIRIAGEPAGMAKVEEPATVDSMLVLKNRGSLPGIWQVLSAPGTLAFDGSWYEFRVTGSKKFVIAATLGADRQRAMMEFIERSNTTLAAAITQSQSQAQAAQLQSALTNIGSLFASYQDRNRDLQERLDAAEPSEVVVDVSKEMAEDSDALIQQILAQLKEAQEPQEQQPSAEDPPTQAEE